MFKIGVAEGVSRQDDMIQSMKVISEIPVEDPQFVEYMADAVEKYSGMVGGMVVARHVGSEYFTNELLPFLRPYIVDGIERFQSGSQMAAPLFIDRVMGITKDQNLARGSEYARYLAKNMDYAIEAHRKDFVTVQQNMVGRSVTGDLFTNTSACGESIKISRALLSQMKGFRNPHGKSVEESMKYRQEEDIKGSGGDMQISTWLLQRTELVWAQVNSLAREAA